ncbi:MAG: hypothetical protein HFI09_01750 [Bacilli bacterium]|nr:hypothetical protein [Bacilli bacterium]
MIIEELYLKANFVVNPVLKTTLQSKTILKNEIIRRANSGLYYITTEENADKIIEESLINSPEPFLSYGLKKPIFYAGIPEFAVSCLDLKLPSTITAIKLEIPYETLALFQIESQNMAYKLFYPNLLIEPFDLKKVYLGLTTNDYHFCYQEISLDEKEKYEVQIPFNEVKLIEKNMGKEIKEQLKEIKKRKNHLKI